ncbi:MAG: universal stress protein [Candidatus Bathyarchaeota archaeon]|nr:universal stress protein [Candidatus Bathyarchaeota archaeon]MDH5787532.1 universal stress protein [Candidatus Bathyarchaeota archaeon]
MATKFLKKILVPIDGSVSSLMAEETAAVIAKKTGASVTVLHATQELKMGYRLPKSVENEILSHIEQEAEKTVNDTRALFKEEKIKVDTKTIGRSDPANSILELSSNYDMTIMGAHGENEKDPYALGSITKKVIHHADYPVLVTKKVSPISNLLICIDGSPNSSKALDYALRLADKMDSKITVLNVQEQKIHKKAPKAVEELGHKILAKSLTAVGKKKVKVDTKLKIGVPSDSIVEVATKGKYDLIVLGSRGLGTVDRFLLGSVSDDVSHKAKCSVLIVPTKK